MERKTKIKIADFSPAELNDKLVELIQDKKGKDIKSLDLSKIAEAITEFFIICHGDSTTQVRAIVGYMDEEMSDRYKIKPIHIEGRNNGEWCLLDYGTVVVHVFTREKREYYQLEQLWCDAKITHYEND